MNTSLASSPAPPVTAPTSTSTTTSDNINVVSSPDVEKHKRKRQPRNSACQGCASLKMKCIGTGNGRCERCTRMDRECIPAVPKPRKRRTRSNVGLDEASPGPQALPLSDILGSEPSPVVQPQPLPPPPPRFESPASLPTRILEYRDLSVKESLPTRRDIPPSSNRPFASLLAHGLGNVAVSSRMPGDLRTDAYPTAQICEELLRGVDHSFVQTSCIVFRQMNSYFPFVDIPANTDVTSLATQRPVLTVAICIVANANQPDVQSRLNQAFRCALSSKVVLGGERGVDLLTGLLVYLAWHHHYMSQQQIYQKLCLLTGMAVDLGLYRKQIKSEDWDLQVNLERDRAFIGCYYLSSSLARIGFDKPNPVRWTDNLRYCAEKVARVGNLPSDRSLVPIVELVHILDDLEENLRFDVNGKVSSPTYPYSVDLHVKSANHRLMALKREYPTLGGTLGFAAASIHVYHRLLQSGPTLDNATLIQCACAIKEYVDDLLARPPATLHQLAIVDWIYLLEILILMARIAKPPGISSTGFDAGSLTSMLQPEALLDGLYSHMASTPSNDPLAIRDESLLRSFGAICNGIKQHILKDINRPSPMMTEKLGARPGDSASQQSGLSDTLRYLGDGVLDETFLRTLTNSI